MSSSSNTSQTWALLVGNCSEWNDPDREIFGDVGFYRILRQVLVENNVVYLQDCSLEHCKESLHTLLEQHTNAGDTLLFYYGGHASKTALKFQNNGEFHYQYLIDLMEDHFRGDRIVFLLDCCYAGSLVKYLPTSSSHISYLCLLCQYHKWEAGFGDSWSLTECMVRVINNQNASNMTVSELCNYMADHHAAHQHQWFQAKLCGNNMIQVESTLESVFPNMYKNTRRELRTDRPLLILQAPPNPHRWKRLVGLKIGDKVYAKWRGRMNRNNHHVRGATDARYDEDMYLLPMYYPAVLTRDVSLHSDEIHLEFSYDDESQSLKFKATLSLRTDWIFTARCFELHDHNHELSIKAHAIMSKHGRYLDCSVSNNTSKLRLWALWDETIYAATILTEPPWHEVTEQRMREERYKDYAGPFVWVEWQNENGDNDLIPCCHCLVQPNKPTLQEMEQHVLSNSTTDHHDDHWSPEKAIRANMESMGRQLSFPSSGDCEGTCYWDGTWREATWIASLPDDCGDTLLQHLHFEVPGNYCCVRWKDEESVSIVPQRLFEVTSQHK